MAKYVISPNIMWTIENFISTFKEVSPAVLIGRLKWQLIFSYFMDSGNEKIHLFLECLNISEALSTSLFKVDCHTVQDDGSPVNNKATATYSLDHKRWCIWSYAVTEIYESCGQINDITFQVTIIPLGSPKRVFLKQGIANEVDNESPCAKSLSVDFGKLFNNDDLSDFVLKCDEKSFHVHKNVLSARSDFFAAMLRCNMREANEGSSKIEDLEPDILELVLRYLYTGKIPELSMESLRKVYAAADRFAVEPLKMKCHSLLLDKFTTDSEKELANVDGKPEDVQTESHKTKEKHMFKELFMTREWRLLSQEFPHKTEEMCKHVFLQN